MSLQIMHFGFPIPVAIVDVKPYFKNVSLGLYVFSFHNAHLTLVNF